MDKGKGVDGKGLDSPGRSTKEDVVERDAATGKTAKHTYEGPHSYGGRGSKK